MMTAGVEVPWACIQTTSEEKTDLHRGWVMSGATLLVDADGAGLGRHVGAVKYRHIASGMQLVQYAGEEQARFRNAGKETLFKTRDEGIAFINALHMMGL